MKRLIFNNKCSNYGCVLSKAILTLYLLFSSISYGQKEANIWYFGNGAGLDFSSGHPEALVDGMLYTNEGCATISDNRGSLLFYTDGIRVWNKQHEQMPNGYGLDGDYSSTQSCQIVLKPGSNKLYYLFTTAKQASSKGLSYSIVDVTMDKGKGDVVLKNKTLLTPVSEKLTVVRNSNGKDFWIITHQWNSNVFYAFPLTSEGLGKPVVSNAGIVHKDVGSGNNGEAIGYMKASPDGKKLALAIDKMKLNNIELFNFDKSSGRIVHDLSLTNGGSDYGIAFSPDNTKLYVSSETGVDGVVQYDLNSRNIPQSAIFIAPKSTTRYGAMQIGPDEKIYVATGKSFLDVIENPNASGLTCNYKVDAINLSGRYSAFGLPDFFIATRSAPDDLSICKVDLGNDTSLYCEKEFVLTANMKDASYLWSTGSTSQVLKVTNTGTYWVTVTKKNCNFVDTIHVVFDGKPSSFACLEEFTPNSDGVNDSFDFMISNAEDFELDVYNARGKRVYQSNDQKKRWDGKYKGKYVPNGVYSWELSYTPSCVGKEKVSKKGKVKLVR